MSPSDQLRLGVDVARWAHFGQVDLQGRDYFDAHLKPIADAAGRVGGDLAAAAGWLHDVIEDTEHTAETLAEAAIGREVIGAVEAVTRRPGEPYRDLIARAAAHPVGCLVKFVDNAWNILSNHQLSAADPARAASLLHGRYLPARETLVAGAYPFTAGELVTIDTVLRRHQARLSTPALS